MLKAKGLRYCSWSGVMFDDLAHGLSFVATNSLFQGIFLLLTWKWYVRCCNVVLYEHCPVIDTE
jgi:hypothetical protein